ncbi:MAG: peptidase T [Anaeromyxobacter sp.]|nr:peptidase T [Anaeromyxobacter sp.]
MARRTSRTPPRTPRAQAHHASKAGRPAARPPASGAATRTARRPGPRGRAEAPEPVLDRFLRYAVIDTQSAEDAPQVPSTGGQLDLARLLQAELLALGARKVHLGRHGYLMAAIPSNLPPGHPARGRVPRVGLVAHLDTSPAAPGAGVRPQLLTYQGGDLALPGDRSVVLRAAENPALAAEVGRRIVTSDGTTLLGADDKAGVAVMMALAEALLRPGAPPHGEVRLAFTPDEEVGRGTSHFDLARFDAEVAYTVDGDGTGELNRETFSADAATVTVTGRSIHPGQAKGVLVNALKALADVIVRLPPALSPEATEGYQPFIHPHGAAGDEGRATLKLLLRDFETEGLARQRAVLEGILAQVRPLHRGARLELSITESYRNMKVVLDGAPRVTAALEEATRRAGVEPRWSPIRGGTDGSRLSAMGLPTPNFFAGGHNFHGKTEWLSVAGLEASLATALQLLQVWVEVSAA